MFKSESQTQPFIIKDILYNIHMYKIPKVPIKMAVILNPFLLAESESAAPALEVI